MTFSLQPSQLDALADALANRLLDGMAERLPEDNWRRLLTPTQVAHRP